MHRHLRIEVGRWACIALASLVAVSSRAAAQIELPAQGQPLVFDQSEYKLPPGGHLQGMQMSPADGERRFLFLSHDSQTVGYLLVVEFATALDKPGRAIHLHTFPGDGQSPPLRHAGGIQLCDNVLAVGLEDNQRKTRSEVQFWDVSKPSDPKQYEHLTIRRQGAPEDQTAGGVGLARLNQRYLAAVANWDSRAIDVYQSNGQPLENAECRFELRARWLAEKADRTDWRPDRETASYQALNLVTLVGAADRHLLLAGLATTATGQDVVDVFRVDLAAPPERILRKESRQVIRLTDDNHFRNAGGLWIGGDRVGVLASPRNVVPQTTLNLAR